MSEPPLDQHDKVLVALDGSPAAATALPFARAVAEQLGARVEILHIAAEGAPDVAVWERIHGPLLEAEAVQVRSRAGDPAAAILQELAHPDVVFVVLTTHGRVVEPGRRLGRVAEAVIAGATDPVLLVRPEAVTQGTSAPPLRRLLLPLDGTPGTARALKPATELACRLAAAIDLLYVASRHDGPPTEHGSIGAPRYVDQPQHEWPQWASEVIDRLCACLAECPASVPVHMFLAQGEIGDEIARFAAEHEIDAIVLVRRSHLEIGRARVLRAVLERTPCPVLVVGGPPT